VFASPETKAMAVGIDHAGWIRLNLKGREPNGAVAPGAEADELMQELVEELLLLEQPESGERIVAEITRADSLGTDLSPDIPDLLVNFREDIGLIESCCSPRVGLVEEAFPVPAHRRSSHRLGPSRLWVRGPGIAPGFDSSGNVLDIAPTVLSLLGVRTPAWMDGRPLSLA
jgi:predicted AlkP superfamily phosphohydrolase/phosphomutase